MKRRSKAPARITAFKARISALHADMFIGIMRDREMEPATLGEMLEDMGNEFLDLADKIRERILAANRREGHAAAWRAAGGNPR